MEYFIAINGEEVGPLTQFRVVEMLRDQEITPQHKAWHKELDDWMPIEAMTSMKPALETLKRAAASSDDDQADPAGMPPLPGKEKKAPVAVEVRPLLRFWARSFDYCIVFMIIFLFADFEFMETPPDLTFQGFSEVIEESRKRAETMVESGEALQYAKMLFFSMLLWHVIEGLCISVFGTTPGKALFGIKVLTYAQTKVSMLKSIIRSFLVYILGVGLFCNPLVILAAMTFAFFRLMARGSTFWDSVLKTQTVHPPMSLVRILLAISAFVALMLIQNLKAFL